MRRFAKISFALFLVLAMAAPAWAARYGRHVVLRTGAGQTMGGATVDVYEAGGSTPADVYAAVSGGSPVNQVTADSDGIATYYVEVGTGASQYQPGQQFKETYTKGSAEATRDYAWTLPFDNSIAQTLEDDLTVAADIYLSGAGTKLQFGDGTSMTTAAVPGSGVTSDGDVSIAADTDANSVGDLTLARSGTQRLRIATSNLVEINNDGTWREATSISGTQTLTNKTLTSPVINTGVSGTAILDEDDMASDSATQVATQQSIKAYVDSGTVTMTNKTLTSPVITGFLGTRGRRKGLAPRYKDADELYIGSGVLEIDGTICSLSTETAFDCDAALGGAFSADTHYFMGFSKPASGTSLTVTDFVVTATAPTWNESKSGWYTAAGARIFNRFLTDGSANIDPLSTWSDRYYGHTLVTILDDTTPAYAAPEAISANAPAWGVPVMVKGSTLYKDDATGSLQYIFGGNSVRVALGVVLVVNINHGLSFTAIANSSGEVKHQGTNTTYTVYTISIDGDWLPDGV